MHLSTSMSGFRERRETESGKKPGEPKGGLVVKPRFNTKKQGLLEKKNLNRGKATRRCFSRALKTRPRSVKERREGMGHYNGCLEEHPLSGNSPIPRSRAKKPRGKGRNRCVGTKSQVQPDYSLTMPPRRSQKIRNCVSSESSSPAYQEAGRESERLQSIPPS